MDISSGIKTAKYTLMAGAVGAGLWASSGCVPLSKYKELEERVEELEQEDRSVLSRDEISGETYEAFRDSSFRINTEMEYNFDYQGALPPQYRHRLEGMSSMDTNGGIVSIYGPDKGEEGHTYFLGAAHTMDPHTLLDIMMESYKDRLGKIDKYRESLNRNIQELSQNLEVSELDVSYSLSEEKNAEERDLEIVAIDRESDLALLKSEKPVEKYIDRLADSDMVEIGSSVINVGFPKGTEDKQIENIENGIITSKAEEYLYTNLHLEGGDSGGPDGGEYRGNPVIVGISSKVNRSRRLGRTQSLIVPPDRIEEFLEENGFNVDEETREIEKILEGQNN